MSVFDDIRELREHYISRRNWYLMAIERMESDIQGLWNDHFSKESDMINSFEFQEVGKVFGFMREALWYFKDNLEYTEKRLEDLRLQEYALKSKSDSEMN